ncbi:MAG TPA: CRTAC1 family protein [Candidatus Acidoferrales bacterium]|nr:CRTAC1 family protein [Candidatus Acidoferrales bacterium]
MKTFPLFAAASAIILSFVFAGAQTHSGKSSSPQSVNKPHLRYPDDDIGVDSLPARKAAQIATENQLKVFYRFHFTDRLKESGITFKYHAVDDVTRHFRADHYDHGSGIAVADVDGDGLYDIYFVNQAGGNELWKNLGNGRFKNITKEAGVGMPRRISVGAAFADVNNSGHPDLFVTTVRGGNVLFKNDGHGHFTDVTKEAAVGLVAHSSGAFFFDFDKDGLVDLLVCNVGNYTTDEKGPDGEYVGLKDGFYGHLHPDRFEHPVLYKNLGNYHFKDVTAEVGLRPHGWCGDASTADINGDGWPDIYFLNMQGSNSYWENEGGKKFVDKTAEYFPRTPWGAMGIKFFDYADEGRPDLLITDMHSDMSQEPGVDNEKKKSDITWTESYLAGKKSDFIFGNALFHQLADGKFEEVSDKMGVETYWPWGFSVGDLNADGWDDIFVSAGMSFPYRYGINSLLLNNRGEKFLDSEFILGVEPRKNLYTPWFEIDCSRDPDAMQGVNQSVCDGQSGKVIAMSPRSSRSSVIFDLDNGGALDIVTNDFNSEPQVFVSDLAQRKKIRWIKIVLAGTASNREGLGARVVVRAGGLTQTKWMDGKSGYLSQSDLPLYFGLGDAAKIDSIEVSWPSGRKQVLDSGFAENRLLKITEP